MVPGQIQLDPCEWVPHNAKFPVLIYRQAFAGPDCTTEIERGFAANGWTGIWHDGVFDYQHYHSGAHEVLGVAAGTATLMIGGPGGEKIDSSYCLPGQVIGTLEAANLHASHGCII